MKKILFVLTFGFLGCAEGTHIIEPCFVEPHVGQTPDSSVAWYIRTWPGAEVADQVVMCDSSFPGKGKPLCQVWPKPVQQEVKPAPAPAPETKALPPSVYSNGF